MMSTKDRTRHDVNVELTMKEAIEAHQQRAQVAAVEAVAYVALITSKGLLLAGAIDRDGFAASYAAWVDAELHALQCRLGQGYLTCLEEVGIHADSTAFETDVVPHARNMRSGRTP